MESSEARSEARPRPLFFVVLVLGLFITFVVLLLLTPAVMTQTTLDKIANEVIQNKTGGKKFVKVAFLADAGLNEASRRVLELVKSEQCDMVIHSGDLDYIGNAAGFYKSVDEILGPAFPYFATMEAYYNLQKERLKQIPGLRCAVVSMRNLACSFEGVSFVTSSVGVNSSRLGLDVKELRHSMVSLWGPSDTPEGVPWMSSPELLAAYEACRLRGAAVLTGHEHYYVRSHSIRRFGVRADEVMYKVTSMQVRSAENSSMSQSDVLMMAPGASFAVVSGLGGHSVSVPSEERIKENPHLAVIHPKYLIRATDPNGKFFFPLITGKGDPTSSHRIEAVMDEKEGYPFGALICTLQQAVTPHAHGVCVFKTISGRIVDRFVVHRAASL